MPELLVRRRWMRSNERARGQWNHQDAVLTQTKEVFLTHCITALWINGGYFHEDTATIWMHFVAQQVLKLLTQLRENTMEMTAFHTCHISYTLFLRIYFVGYQIQREMEFWSNQVIPFAGLQFYFSIVLEVALSLFYTCILSKSF